MISRTPSPQWYRFATELEHTIDADLSSGHRERKAMSNKLSERALRKTYRETTCSCGSYVWKDHYCFDGQKSGLSFVEWIADMAIKYPKLGWMRKSCSI